MIASPHSEAVPGGVTLAADLRQLAGSERLVVRLGEHTADLIDRGFSVGLRIDCDAGEEDATGSLETVCKRLAAVPGVAQRGAAGFELSIAGGMSQPETLWRLMRECFGECAINLVCDAGSFSSPAAWLSLWRLRRDPALRIVTWPQVSSPSPLLSSEPARSVLPGTALQVPGGTAWVCARISLPAYAALSPTAASRHLKFLLNVADAAHEQASWPTAAMRHDAWLNRRVAIIVDDLGDYALARNWNPASHGSLRKLRRVLMELRRALSRESQRMSGSKDLLPAIALQNPAHRLPAGVESQRWRDRWAHELARSSLRHRNLLCLSPWSLLPGSAADPRYMNLLPALALADVCSFGERPSLSDWNANDFKRFHEQVWALLRKNDAHALVAEPL